MAQQKIRSTQLETPGGGGGGTSIVDTRRLARWHALGAAGVTRKIAETGDSTKSEPVEGQAIMPTVDGPAPLIYDEFPSLADVIWCNRGVSGAVLRDFGGNGTYGGNGTIGNNSNGYSGNRSDVVAINPHLYVFRWGLNDARGSYGPPVSNPPVGTPNWLGAYGTQGMIDMALSLQYYMKVFITAARTANPVCDIIIQVPNGLNETMATGYKVNGVTTQNMLDLIALTYRGDSNLGVPNPETFGDGTGILVVDSRRSIYKDTPYINQSGLLKYPNNGLHPTSSGYKEEYYLLGSILDGPRTDALVSQDDARKAAAKERALAAGWNLPSYGRQILEDSGEWDRVTTLSVVASGSWGFAYSSDDVVFTYGGGTGSSYGSAELPALARGDVVIWDNNVVQTIKNPDGFNQGVYLQTPSSLDLSGGSAPGPAASATSGEVYRHRYANNITARRNTHNFTTTGFIASASLYKYQYPITIISSSLGSITFTGVSTTKNGKHASNIGVSTEDMLCLSGADTISGISEYGVALTTATITRSGNQITVAMTGQDFSTTHSQAGILLTNANPAVLWNNQTGTAYTLKRSDAENGIAMSSASANAITVPPTSAVNFPINTPIYIMQDGAGQTTVTPGAGVTINKRGGGALATAGRYGVITLIRRPGTDIWTITGDLA